MQSAIGAREWRRLLPMVVGAVAALLVLVGPGSTGPAAAQICGDADGSGSITVTDGVRVLRAAAGLGACDLALCDADGSGTVTVSDGVNVLRAAAGLGDPTGCGSDGGLAARRTFLRDLAGVIALPGYRTLDTAAIELQTDLENLVSTPGGELLVIAQDAWRNTRRAWKETEAFRIGPSETLGTSARIDWPSADTSRIDGEIAAGAALSSDYLDTLDAQEVGFQAIEYFIFDPEGGNAGAVNGLLGPDNARRRAYLLALGVNLRAQTEQLLTAWEPAGGDYGADLVDSGIGGEAFPTLKEAFDAVINRVIRTAEVVEEDRLGAPLGVNSGGTPHPELVESPRSGDTLPGVIANLQGIANVYRGTFQGVQGSGIGAQVAPLSPEIDANVRQLLDDAIAAVQAVPPPLADAVLHHRDEAQAAYDAVQNLRRALTVDVASVLGVALTESN